ncbi:MAG: TolC family protein [Ferruginibacter sp.]|nr:TolC family protein [Ferruginibacter sp.]
MVRITLLFIAFLSGLTSLSAQQNVEKILMVDDFINTIKQYHPLAKVAAIVEDKAAANLLIAKGGFDPILNFDANAKSFDGKNYYTYNNADIKIPLPIGDFKTGIENNRGQFLTSEITRGRSSFAGFEFPLAKNLLIDKRRAALQQARIAVNENRQQRNMMMNDLLLDSYISYYEWSGAYKLYNIFSDYVTISADRLRLVQIGYQNGDRAAMDTTEAYIQMQNFMLLQNDAAIVLNSATYEINNFLWDERGAALQIAENINPDTSVFNEIISSSSLQTFLVENIRANPLLLQYQFKLQGLGVEKRLKFQGLLPEINAKAFVLNRDFYPLKNIGIPLLENNNRWGIDVKIPLFFREGRGEYRIAKLKIEETTLFFNQKTIETENKIRDYYYSLLILQRQVTTANSALVNSNSLLKNELLRFNNGESSLFLVNSRENKVLEITQKLIELQLKLFKAKYSLDWAAGLLSR